MHDHLTRRVPWKAVGATTLFLWHGLAMLYANLPSRPLYPGPPHGSGLAPVQQLEQGMLALRAGMRVGAPWLTGALDSYVGHLGLSQPWTTFAPVPPDSATWYSVVAYDARQQGTVLWTNLPPRAAGASSAYSPLTVYLTYTQWHENLGLRLLFVRHFQRPDASTVALLQHRLPIYPSPGPQEDTVSFQMHPADRMDLVPRRR